MPQGSSFGLVLTDLIKQHSMNSATAARLADLRARWRRERAFATGLTLSKWGLVLAPLATLIDFVYFRELTFFSDAALLLGCLGTYFGSRKRLVWWPLYLGYWITSNVTIYETGGILSPVGGLFFAVIFICGISVQARFKPLTVFLFTLANVAVWGLIQFLSPLGAQEIPIGFTASINLINLTVLGLCAFGYIRAEAQLEREYSREEAANAAKTIFLASVSHELRTPLGAIMGFAELIQDPASREEDRYQYADTIRRNGEHLTKLVDNLLDLSKIEAGHMELENLEFDPSDVIGDVVNLLRFKAEKKGLLLTFSVQDDVPEAVMADPLRFKQILMNLVGNSIKFTESGTVTIEARFDHRAPGTGNLIVEVRDTGPGLSTTERERLFRPYVQADASVSRRFGGTGLGLSLSKRLAEMMNGDLQVLSSELGMGSVFCFYVHVRTLKERRAARVLPVAPPSRKGDSRLKGRRILVVDDSSDNRHLIQKYLENSEADVHTVGSGRAAIELAHNEPFDLILMDLQMPEMDGIECTRTLREDAFRKPIVALTAHAMHQDRDRCLQVGFDDFMTKPISRAELIGKLSQLFAPA